jgi:hypothetical protein
MITVVSVPPECSASCGLICSAPISNGKPRAWLKERRDHWVLQLCHSAADCPEGQIARRYARPIPAQATSVHTAAPAALPTPPRAAKPADPRPSGPSLADVRRGRPAAPIPPSLRPGRSTASSRRLNAAASPAPSQRPALPTCAIALPGPGTPGQHHDQLAAV